MCLTYEDTLCGDLRRDTHRGLLVKARAEKGGAQPSPLRTWDDTWLAVGIAPFPGDYGLLSPPTKFTPLSLNDREQRDEQAHSLGEKGAV